MDTPLTGRRAHLVIGLLLGLAAATAAPVEAGVDQQSVGTPAEGQLYHGVYPGGRTGWEDDITPADLTAYEDAAGAEAAWVYFSNNWFRSRAFPAQKAAWITARGAVPFIRLMLRTANPPRLGHPYTLDRIIRGDFDAALTRWGQAAADFGDPLVVEYGTEVNGEWFGWNGRWNGRSEGPARFRRAYRHIVRTMDDQGADNITWVFHVNGQGWPRTTWNRFENYYPGDAWVDWVGLSSYGALTPADRPGDWEDFRVALDRVVPRLAAMAPGKPVFVFEFGFTDHNPCGNAADFADAALDDLIAGRWPEVRGFSWWNETWENDDDPTHDTDMRVQTVPDLAEVFQDHLTDPAILTSPLP